MGEYYAIHQNDELKHYGVLGMKWGVRRYQNADGSLTPAGLKRDSRLREKTKKLAKKSYTNAVEARDRAKRKTNGSLYYDLSNRYMSRAQKTASKMSDGGKRIKKQKGYMRMTAANTIAGEYYVKRKTSERLASAATSAAVSTGMSFAGMLMGMPIGVLYIDPGPKYKLKMSDLGLTDELFHAEERKETKKHKYIARIKIKDKKYRYFYDMKAYKNFLKGKEATKNMLDDFGKESTENLGGSSESSVNGALFVYNSDLIKKAVKWIGEKLGIIKKESTDEETQKQEIPKKEAPKKEVPKKEIPKKKIPKKETPKKETKSSRYNIIKDGGTDEKGHKYIAKVELPNGKYRYFYDEDEYNRFMEREKYQDSEPDFLKDLPEIDIEESMYPDDVMDYVNEGYDPWDATRSMNCAYCTTAYEMRMRGYDVQAAEFDSYTYDADPWTMDSWFEDADTRFISPGGQSVDVNEYVDGDHTYEKEQALFTMLNDDYNVDFASSRRYSGSALEEALKNNPPGSRGNLAVYWTAGGGHSVAYEIAKNGDVIIRDTQSNDVYTPDEFAEYGIAMAFYYRSDNLEFTERGMHTLEPRKN